MGVFTKQKLVNATNHVALFFSDILLLNCYHYSTSPSALCSNKPPSESDACSECSTWMLHPDSLHVFASLLGVGN